MYQIGFFILIFLLGSIPFGLLISRYWLKIDIRQEGSGNIGMTNVMRVGGKLPGILTFVLDFAKGSLAVLSAQIFFPLSETTPETQLVLHSLAGVIAVCGHVFSVFLRFKGGKGISTLFGVLAVLQLNIGIFAALLWAGIFFWKRISSLAGITMLAVFPWLFLLFPWILQGKIIWPMFFLFLLLSSLLIFKHRENIQRLLKGQEGQLSSSNKQ
ncbi:MAG: glycerol-3-phosphate 1-O-acyltransferase PlsY [SAR324 cluster bacterium]|nr:glycerol-3-phosphate 1-O-acyltransferase PlsY [SAR324 cluster bacterium]MBL7034457.1 glycerol-3-phosphate 1-O-acyltransferase PlsY [SAR324 cluster bacterium]